jgi:hypothetical protein
MTPVQYRVVVARSEQRTDGPDDAPVTISLPLEVAIEPGFEAEVEFMRGRLKVTGPTSAIFEALRTGEATRALLRLASHP